MRSRCCIFLLLLMAFALGGMAQTFETGGLVGAEYEMKILKRWHWNAEAELRLDENFTHYDRLKLGVGTDYSFWKKRVKVGVFYNYLNYHETDFYESRHRVGTALSFSQKLGDCKLSYRAIFQSTFRDERRGDYTFNPKTYMRNRLSFTYNFPEKPVKMHASEEFWWRLYHPERNIIDGLRTVVGVEYDVKKHHTLDFFLRMDNEVQVNNPNNVLYLGVTYKYQ